MKRHMQRLVLIEETSCFRDFLDFEVIGKRYKMTHGTFRNKISTFIKKWSRTISVLFRTRYSLRELALLNLNIR
jgi:hypothetical protein